MSKDPPQGRVTFRGRGLAFVHGPNLVVKLCPLCSQWNSPQAAERGQCGWCAYIPLIDDVKPVSLLLQSKHR